MAAVVLRPVEDGDLPAIFEWHHDDGSVRLAAVPPRPEQEFRAHWARNRADPAVLLRTIVADGVVVGYIGSWDVDGRPFVGYWVGPPYWGRGVASDALSQFVRLDDRRPLHARVAEHNAASRRVLEKSGFRLVGEERVEDGPDGAPYTALQLVLDA